MKYAVIRSGGKQHKVSEGDVITLDRLPQETGEDVVFSDVLMFVSDKDVKLGRPHLSDVSVKGIVEEVKRGKKIRVATFKAKARHRRVKGYRQALTTVKIGSITELQTKAQAVKARTKKPQSSVLTPS